MLLGSEGARQHRQKSEPLAVSQRLGMLAPAADQLEKKRKPI